MGRSLADASAAAASVFEDADRALGWPVSELCWNGPDERLTDTRYAQPALLTTSMAALAALRESARDAGRPLEPRLVAGHSVGEYAALVAAGAVSLQDGLHLVSRRGQLMAEAAAEGGMAAVIGLSRADIAAALAGTPAAASAVIANDNAPGQVVISGPRDALDAASAAVRAAGARRVIELRVSGPFHTPAMAPVGADLAAAFAGFSWHRADPPLVSNVTARPVSDSDELRVLLARQVAAPVEWVAVVETMVAAGIDTFVECGAGAALVGMIRRIAPSVAVHSVVDAASLAETVHALPARAAVRA